MTCPETDQLVTLASVFDAEPREALAHLQSCDECLTSLSELGLLRSALSQSVGEEMAVASALASAERLFEQTGTETPRLDTGAPTAAPRGSRAAPLDHFVGGALGGLACAVVFSGSGSPFVAPIAPVLTMIAAGGVALASFYRSQVTA